MICLIHTSGEIIVSPGGKSDLSNESHGKILLIIAAILVYGFYLKGVGDIDESSKD